MELTIEYTKDLGFKGGWCTMLVHPDETLSLVYDRLSVFYGRTVVVDTANNNNSAIGDASIISSDAPSWAESTHVGPQNWLMWRSVGRQRIAMVPEAPKIMNDAFYKGFITGSVLRHTGLHKPYTSAEYETSLPDEDRISYNNGLLLGQVCTL